MTVSDISAGANDRASSPPGPHRRGRVLLVCAPLFSYHQSIQAELEALGFDVTWWNDRVSDSSLHKLGLRLLPELVAGRSTAAFQQRLEQLDCRSVVRVLVVKGEGMSDDFIVSLKSRLPGIPLSLYFWDSVRNARRARRIAPLFDRVATFDPVDAIELGWLHRPLFARTVRTGSAPSDDSAQYDWSFIGTLHSDRYKVVDRLRRSEPGLRSYFFGFAPSRLVMAARYLADWRLWKAPRGSVSTKTMPASDVAAISHASRSVLDIEHPRQRGLTMRTIETLLSQRKLITTNRQVLASDLFHPSRVHVISRERPEIPRWFLDLPFEPIDEHLRAKYTLRRWILDLIGDVDATRTVSAIGTRRAETLPSA
jgi:hypothetical protein